MSEFYSPRQLQVVRPFLEGVIPKWLVVGGPADANEAQTAHWLWPGIKVLGVEPNMEAIQFQHDNGWQPRWPLLWGVLLERSGFVGVAHEQGMRNDRVQDSLYAVNSVPAMKLDDLETQYGPFEDSIMWLDVERSEDRVLAGAVGFIESRRALLWNIEIMADAPGNLTVIPMLMSAGYVPVAQWNDSPQCRDVVFLRDDLFIANKLCQFPKTYVRDPDHPLLKFLV